MKKNIFLLLPIICFIGCNKNINSALENDPHTLLRKSQCGDGSTMQTMSCLTKIGGKLNLEMDHQIKLTKNSFNNQEAFKDFETAQKDWEAYMNSNCQVMSDYAQGGTYQKVYYAVCSNEITHQRIQDLKMHQEFFESHP